MILERPNPFSLPIGAKPYIFPKSNDENLFTPPELLTNYRMLSSNPQIAENEDIFTSPLLLEECKRILEGKFQKGQNLVENASKPLTLEPVSTKCRGYLKTKTYT